MIILPEYSKQNNNQEIIETCTEEVLARAGLKKREYLTLGKRLSSSMREMMLSGFAASRSRIS